MPRLGVLIDRPSNSARALATSLGVKRVRPERASRLRYLTLVNWGVSTIPAVHPRTRLINPPEAVRNATDKMLAFSRIPAAYRPRASREPFIPDSGILLARRNFLSGGNGITVVRNGQQAPAADFYVEYVRKSHEYRVHVAFGRVIHVQQKRKRSGIDQTSDQQLIRNHDNGWVFTEQGIEYPSDPVRDALHTAAVECVAGLGLDIAACDMIICRSTNRVVFLESNTRPGLESTRAIAAYTSAINSASANGR